MNLLALALIPVVGLLLFIYFNDKNEKEPFGYLIGLFFTGMATIITAVIAEWIGQAILNALMPSVSVIRQVLLVMLIVAPAEEFGKYLVLRLRTWKNKNFNYSYDAIVYAVFISLGFAALENVGYVIMSGISAALLRMVTAVPGHACFAVFMGFFYGKAKYASLTDNKKGCAGYKALAIIVPILLHGIYDGIIFGGEATGAALLSGLSLVLWIIFVIALIIVSCILVVKSSRNDFCIITLSPDQVPVNVAPQYQTQPQYQTRSLYQSQPQYQAQPRYQAQPKAPFQVVYKPSAVGSWTCSCGAENNLNFCFKCGRQRSINSTWYCPSCGTLSVLNFCGNCGTPRTMQQPPAMG